MGRNSAVGVASRNSFSMGSSYSTCAHARKPKIKSEASLYLDFMSVYSRFRSLCRTDVSNIHIRRCRKRTSCLEVRIVVSACALSLNLGSPTDTPNGVDVGTTAIVSSYC